MVRLVRATYFSICRDSWLGLRRSMTTGKGNDLKRLLLGVALGPAKLRLIDHAFVVIECAFCPVLAPDLGYRHTSDNSINSGADIDIRTVRHQRDLVASRELVFGQWASPIETLGAAHDTPPGMSARLKIDGRGLTLLSTLQLEADCLTLIEGLESSTFNGRDVDENVLRAVGRLNESETLLGVKPLYST
jgi:hypothetical protein